MTDTILVLLDVDLLTGTAPAAAGVEPSGAGPSSAPLGAPLACYANSGDDRLCTLPRGHTGRHEAQGPLPANTVLHSWDGTA